MSERTPIPRWVLAVAVGLLVALVSLVVYWWRPGQPVAVPTTAPAATTPEATVARVWLSTADRRLQLAPQADAVTDDAAPVDGEAGATTVTIDLARTYQTMVGFGAALTDSSAWLLQNKQSEAQRTALLQELFGPPPGLNFNLIRVTIGASDFSLQHYTLDDLGAGEIDPQLQHFNIAEDLRTVIPVARAMLAIQPQLRIIASPWSAPAWMKTSAHLISGTLLEQYEATYANYLVRYVDAVARQGLPIFALTVQNEPNFEPLTYPGMLLSAAARARIIGRYLGPALAERQPRPLILGWDHNWDTPQQPLDVLADADAGRYVDGIAWHCYRGNVTAQTRVHRAAPRKDVYLTECSGGDWASAKKGELLFFARNIVMGGVKSWARGVVYWNLALDEQHGPHAGGCGECKGVVTIDAATGAVSRNDEYYAFGHFSRFVLPGAVRVKSSAAADGIDNVAFQNAHGGPVVLVVVNGNAQDRRVSVAQGATRFHYDLPALSVATFTWPPGAGAATTAGRADPPSPAASTGIAGAATSAAPAAVQ